MKLGRSHRQPTALFCVAGLIWVGAVLQTPPRPRPSAPPARAPTYVADVLPLFKKYCLDCHEGSDAAAGLNLGKIKTQADATARLESLETALRRVQRGEMPPKGLPKPSAAETVRFAGWVKAADDATRKAADPGRVTLRRLNRVEYDNTIRDLLGLDLKLSQDFPSDDVGEGFDNIGDVLSISPLLMEKYLDAAEKVATQAIRVVDRAPRRVEGSEMKGPSSGSNINGTAMGLYAAGTATADVTLIESGDYRLRIFARGDQAGSDPVKMSVAIDGKSLGTLDVRETRATAFEIPVSLSAGKRRISVSFLNDYYQPDQPQGRRDRNLYVHNIELQFVGTTMDATLPPSHRRVIPRDVAPAAAKDEARRNLEAFASRAYRRPVRLEEVDRLMKLYEVGERIGGFELGMRVAVQGVLSSPSFLFRTELDHGTVGVRPLTDFEVASRLSYFLWSSMPDDRLFDLAKKGSLRRPEVLKAEIQRMVADGKTTAFAHNFAGQWLQLKKLEIVEPDATQYPGIDARLKADMAEETERFFLHILRENRPVSELLTAKYTFLNGRLAKHYGIAGVEGLEFRRVELTGERAGLLSQASVLLVTSNPTRTSPTKRGKWVLENVLGTPPPPPPPGVAQIAEEKQKLEGATLRQLLEQHRKNPECASCHQRMDPIGYGLENFDVVGRWRTQDAGRPVEAYGTLPDGTKFNGPTELRKILVGQRDQITRALAERMLVYGLGRGLIPGDRVAVDRIVQQTKANDYRLSAMVLAVATSEPFLKRNALPVPKETRKP